MGYNTKCSKKVLSELYDMVIVHSHKVGGFVQKFIQIFQWLHKLRRRRSCIFGFYDCLFFLFLRERDLLEPNTKYHPNVCQLLINMYMGYVERQAQHRPDRLKKPRTGSVGTDRLGRFYAENREAARKDIPRGIYFGS